MEILGLLFQNHKIEIMSREKIYCAIRKEWLESSPEEIVRQEVLHRLVERCGFPLSCIAVEQQLKQMPHLRLSHTQFPNRRADIVCFAKGIHPTFDLYPLLLIECKAVKLTSKVINQVVGYNHYLQAFFIAAVNQDEVRLGWIESTTKTYTFIAQMPSYTELLAAIKPKISKI
jgi:hypothetical protein